MTVTLDQLRTRVLDRVEFVTSSNGDGFVSRTELDGYINAVGSELHDLLVVRYEDHLTSPFPTTFSLSGSSFTYSLPSDFFKLRGVDWDDGGTWVPLRRYNHQERGKWLTPSSNWDGDRDRRFLIMGSYLTFVPQDDCSGGYRFWYVPRWTDLSGSSQALPTVMEQWSEYIVVGAGIKCRAKEESDASALMAEKAELLRRIEAGAQNRDAADQEFIGSTWNWDW